MKRVLTAVILIPIVVLALFRAPLCLFALLVLGVALLAAREYFDIAAATGYKPFRGLGYGLLVLLFAFVVVISLAQSNFAGQLANNVRNMVLILSVCAFVLIVLSPYLFMVLSMGREPLSQSLGDAAVSFLLLLYIGLPLVLLVPLRASEYGSLYLLVTMLLVWGGDIAALYVGRAIGKNKLAPRVSPGKTWEGAAASALTAMVISALLFHYINQIASALIHAHIMPGAAGFDLRGGLQAIPLAIPRFQLVPTLLAVIFGFCINVAAQLGDLVESAMKRGAGLKDSGTLLPGHGGVLDRIDALLFAMPVAFLFSLSLGRYFGLYGLG